jgi:hypothetical protein
MTACTLVDFDVSIHGEQPPYHVTATYGDSTATGQFAEAITDPWWQKARQALDRSTRIADADAIRAAGSRLFRGLFHGDVRDLWVASRADAEHERISGLRLRLDVQPPAVNALPWESLYDARRSQVFAASDLVTVVRVASLYADVRPARRLAVSLPLRVVIAAPEDPFGQIDAAAEIAKVQQAVADVGPGLIETIPYTGRFSITQLRSFLSRTKPAVFHFVGHGEPDGLVLWRNDRAAIAGGASLASLVDRVRSIKLAVLNACLAGQPDGRRPFGSVAMQMLQTGLPAVIAMQFAIRDDAAIDFAGFLYDSLLRGDCPGRIDLAVTAARGDLYLTNPGDFSFGTPVLWLNERQGRVFELDAPPTGEAAPARAAPGLDVRAERRWLTQFGQSTAARQLAPEFQFLAAKQTSLADTLRGHLAQLAAPESAATAYGDTLADYRRYKAAALRVQRLIKTAAT